MKNLFFHLFLIAFLFSSCDLLNSGDEPPNSENLYGLSDGDVFIYVGHWSQDPPKSLVYSYKDGSFIPSRINRVEATDFEMTSDSTMKVFVEERLNKEYVIAKKMSFKYSDYGT